MGLTFAAPAFLALLAALPFVVWWHVRRMRHRPRAVAALFLWDEARRAASTRRRWRPTWTLLLQLAAVAAAAIALAQPSLDRRGPPDLVVVLDAGARLAAVDPEGRRIDRARAAVLELAEDAGAVALVRAGAVPELALPFTRDRAALRAALDELPSRRRPRGRRGRARPGAGARRRFGGVGQRRPGGGARRGAAHRRRRDRAQRRDRRVRPRHPAGVRRHRLDPRAARLGGRGPRAARRRPPRADRRARPGRRPGDRDLPDRRRRRDRRRPGWSSAVRRTPSASTTSPTPGAGRRGSCSTPTKRAFGARSRRFPGPR